MLRAYFTTVRRIADITVSTELQVEVLQFDNYMYVTGVHICVLRDIEVRINFLFINNQNIIVRNRLEEIHHNFAELWPRRWVILQKYFKRNLSQNVC